MINFVYFLERKGLQQLKLLTPITLLSNYCYLGPIRNGFLPQGLTDLKSSYQSSSFSKLAITATTTYCCCIIARLKLEYIQWNFTFDMLQFNPIRLIASMYLSSCNNCFRDRLSFSYLKKKRYWIRQWTFGI